MIIASRTRDRIDVTSGTVEPVAFSSELIATEPNPRFTPAPAVRAPRPSAPLERLHVALRRRPLRAALPKPQLVLALLLVMLLAVLADAFASWAQLELRAAHGHASVETTLRLLCGLAAVLFFDRFWRRPRLRTLLPVAALAILAAFDLVAGGLLACACVEWSLEERRAAARLLARERRQMAADVHDLIMQDLSLALANARTLTDDPTRAPQASTVVTAGERALAGARDVVSGLSEHDTRPIAQALEASVRAAARHTPLTFDAARVPSSAPLDRPTRDALVHIAREAVTNAVKHARPKAIDVVLEHAGQWRLTVRDDGRGFDETPPGFHETPSSGGFGLTSMRQSAHALGGAVHVCRVSGGGTTVEAVLP
jgi:signal transduction histidine kinase